MSQPTFWAVLIGIDYYENQPLHGCVSDVKNVEQLLRDTLEPSRLRIQKITAEAPNEPHPPTYGNVMNVLQDMKKNAVPGDLFYLHYSGHGGLQLQKDDPQHPQHYSNSGETYEVLVLSGDKHLKDYELGHFLDSMASGGVRTFAVLDCCHSGGADRVANGTVRGLDGIIPPDEDDNGCAFNQETVADTQGPTRDGSARPSYWVRARKYTLLTACQPHEYAREFVDHNLERHGALTFTMLKSARMLSAGGVIPTYKTLYWDIIANISGISASQHPMLFGERDFHLFGTTCQQTTRLAVVNRIRRERVYINRGEVHGVRVGEEYAVHPRGALDLSQIIGRFKIDSVSAMRASAKITSVMGVEKGCPVTLTAPVIADILRVKVQSPALLQELQMRPQRTIQFDAYNVQGAPYQVLFRETHYEITDATGTPLPNCPMFNINEETSTNICNFLQKFAHNRMVAQLHNRRSRLNGLFTFMEQDGKYEVFHEDVINFLFKNLKQPPPIGSSSDVLYFTVLNLRSNWDVAVVIPDPDDRDDPIAVKPGETSRPYDMEMTITNSQAVEEDDIFKVIVTTQPCRFDMLDTTGSVSRGGVGISDIPRKLEDVLQILGEADRAGAPPEGRRVGDWQTANLIIKTRRGEEN
jgi:hypothetical protein